MKVNYNFSSSKNGLRGFFYSLTEVFREPLEIFAEIGVGLFRAYIHDHC